MPYRVSNSVLNASTLDILNVIRQNASYEYQSLVPAVTQATDIPKVGEVLYGHPAMANQFLNALINRIAAVRVKSATFNNPYASLKKGYLRFGETVEEIFVEMAKAVEFSAEKGAAREFKRTLPKVRSAFHVMNWRVLYPVTIQDEDLRMAFTSMEGVQDLIAKIVNTVYTAAEYDEFLLFKYLLIKSINKDGIKKQYLTTPAGGDADKTAAIAFRGLSNKMEFISDAYNASGVHTNTKRADLFIFMDAEYNAQFDVNVLSAAFNMDKADFMGHLKLIDDWTTFDNDRFDIIRENSDGLEEVTAAELAAMANVKAIIVDEEFFQIYDNNNKFTEDYVAAGLYWNYFYHVWKTVSWSPFSNAVAILDGTATAAPATITATVTSIDTSSDAEVYNIVLPFDGGFKFVQSEALTSAGVAVTTYGTIIIPTSAEVAQNTAITFLYADETYTVAFDNFQIGEVTFTKVE